MASGCIGLPLAEGPTPAASDTATLEPPNPVLEVLDDPLLGRVVSVRGGTFPMGAPVDDPDADPYEFPQHEVTVSGFSIMDREVSQSLYEQVMGANPSFFTGCPTCPVESVDWDDAVQFAATVSVRTGTLWRLPTEAEWEFAARGGDDDARFAGSATPDGVAWYDGNSGGSTHPSCEKDLNGFGLCDMSGNVAEWVSDIAGDYSGEPQVDPQGPESGCCRTGRGGSWFQPSAHARVTHRGTWTPDSAVFNVGVRLVHSE